MALYKYKTLTSDVTIQRSGRCVRRANIELGKKAKQREEEMKI